MRIAIWTGVLALAMASAAVVAGLPVEIDRVLDQGDYSTAVRLIRPLAERGDPSAEFNLGILYATGRGVPQDNVEASKWYRRAAEKGYAPAQFYLARLYEDGLGVTQSYGESLEWYRKSAEQNYEDAQYILGLKYAEGKGVARDLVMAHMWFNLAAHTGNLKAINARNVVARKMTPDQVADAEKLAGGWLPKRPEAK